MKISAKQYAISLFESVKDAPENKLKEIIASFVKIISKNNDIAQIEKIINNFNLIWNKDNAIVDAEVVSAHPLDNKVVNLISSHIIKITGAKDLNLVQRVDKGILGGIVLKYDDKILDASLKTKISDFAQRLKM